MPFQTGGEIQTLEKEKPRRVTLGEPVDDLTPTQRLSMRVEGKRPRAVHGAVPDQPIESRPGVPIPDQTEFKALAEKIGFKGREIVERVQRDDPKEFGGLRQEMSDALARGIVNTTSGGLDALERAAQSSVFPPGFFSDKAEVLREIGKIADIQPASLPKDASKRRKTGAFVANAVGETIPFMAASLGSTLLTGTPMAAFATSFTIEGENARQEALAAGATEQDADMEAFVVGTINGALESLQVDELLKFSGVGKASKRAFVEAVRDKSLKKLAQAGGQLSLAAAKTAVTEGIQEGLQETTSILTPAISGRELPKPSEAFKRIGQATLGGAVVGPILGGAVSAATGTQADIPVQEEITEAPAPPAVGEAVEPAGLTERAENGRQRDEKRREELRPRPGSLQDKLRQRATKAEKTLETRQGEVLEAGRPRAGLKKAKAAAVKPVAAKPKVSSKIRQSAQRIANANKKPVFIKGGKLLKSKPSGEFVTVKPHIRVKAGAVAPKVKVAAKPATPAVRLARQAVARTDPTTIVTAKTPEITERVSQVVERDFTQPKPKGETSARQADIAEDRESMGLSEINSKTRRGWESALKTAKKQKIHRKAPRLADEILETPRSLSDVETAGLTIRMAELKAEHKQTSSTLRKAKDSADIETQAAEVGRIEEEFDKLSRAVDMSGTEKGRALAAQKLTINRDFDLISTVTRAKAAKKADLSLKERASIERLTKGLESATTKIDRLSVEVQEMKAKRFVRRGRAATEFKRMSKQAKDSDLADLVAKTNALLKQGCNN